MAELLTSILDNDIEEVADRANMRTLTIWACDCAERVIGYFERDRPGDDRPRQAVGLCRLWIGTGEPSMADIRAGALAAHGAAREIDGAGPAHSAARAAGQALATAHMAGHATTAAVYAATAVRDASASGSAAEQLAVNERRWQLRRLLDLVAEQPTP